MRLDFGAFSARIRSRVRELAAPLFLMYSQHPRLDGRVCDMHVALETAPGLRARFGRRISFSLDGFRPTDPGPVTHALALLEWGLNIGIALRGQHLLMFHSGALARDDKALLLPAGPGSGKSTLTAALCQEGWRLLSDEFGLVDPDTGLVLAMPRPVGLKNEAIDVIRIRYPDAVLGPRMAGTIKGTVSHLQPPMESVARLREAAWPRLLVFPRWREGAPLNLAPLDPMQAFQGLARNAFNYQILGEKAFETLLSLVEGCGCYGLEYSDLSDALPAIDDLIARHA